MVKTAATGRLFFRNDRVAMYTTVCRRLFNVKIRRFSLVQTDKISSEILCFQILFDFRFLHVNHN